ncbi:hypothetical protein GOP47_0008373 [Adiantum capillus-veneris]|uniref:Uncharacterized protein n=1 Tax=Adiantum capillus-veneris TaxID=13818 RepID=A0A9D4UZ74_ADICA|nr:hypothetical protein GOP47_0008373 [Adiantum capillus-veneris]
MEPENGLKRTILPWPEDYEALPAVMTFHHHHLYEFTTEKLSEDLIDDHSAQQTPLSTFRDHNGFAHSHFHSHRQEPTWLTLHHYHPEDPLQIQVISSTLLARTALFVEPDHLHFRHQYVHLHKIFCRQMWPEKIEENDDPKKRYRIFFPDLQTRTMTKTGVFFSDKSGFAEFHYYNSHWHTLMATAALHPEGFQNLES